MPEGPLGFERLIGDEEAQLAISIPTTKSITKATVESANGYVISGELRPFFEVDSVARGSPFPDIDEEHIVVFTSDSADIQDIKMMHSNLSRDFGVESFFNSIRLSPSASTGRPLTSASNTPKLLFKIESSRGTPDEFRSAVNDVILEEFNFVSQPEFIDGENIAYITAEAVVSLGIVDDWASDILGPRNKKVTDIEVNGII